MRAPPAAAATAYNARTKGAIADRLGMTAERDQIGQFRDSLRK